MGANSPLLTHMIWGPYPRIERNEWDYGKKDGAIRKFCIRFLLATHNDQMSISNRYGTIHHRHRRTEGRTDIITGAYYNRMMLRIGCKNRSRRPILATLISIII